jgi:hypothetical protein
MADRPNSDVPASTPAAPLFYRKPQALAADLHADLKLKAEPDFRFAADVNAVPIMGAEFAEVTRFYPIVFAGEPAYPVAVLGLQRSNLFVDAEGRWREGRYIPAYVRRYPFVFIGPLAQGGFVLGVDIACDRFSPQLAEGAPFHALFEDGKPSLFTQEAMRFASALQVEHAAAGAFVQSLAEHDLLVDQQAEGALPGGRRFQVGGFRIVDAAKFQALPDAVVLGWHKRGWLGLIQFHLASLDRFRDLLALQGVEAGPTLIEPVTAEPSTAKG